MKYFALKDLRTDKGKVSAGQIFFSDEVFGKEEAVEIIVAEKRIEERIKQKLLPNIVIPHHNRWDLLGACLKSIPMEYKVFVVRDGTFAHGCNQGFKLTKGKFVIYLNDDVEVSKEGLEEMVESDADIVGSPFIYPNGDFQMWGVKISWDEGNKNIYVKKREQVDYPSGSFFKIKRSLFKELGGFDEIYQNGAEDRELFMKAIERGCSFDYVKSPSIHHLSASEGRTSRIAKNNKIFDKRFPERRIKKIFKLLKR